MTKAWAHVAAVDADDDAQLFAGREFQEELPQGGGQLMKEPEVVPLRGALDIMVQASAEQWHKANGPIAAFGVGVQSVDGLQPDERELDRVFALVCLREEEPLGLDAVGERLDQVRGAGRRARRA